jgi:hypothetical protein
MQWNEFDKVNILERLGPNEFYVRFVWNYKEFYNGRTLIINDLNRGALNVGDTIRLEDKAMGDNDWRYLGHSGDGILISYIDREETDLWFLRKETLAVGTNITITAESISLCFLAGTLIACPERDRRVEDLATGDVVSTADGGTRRVKWIGRQTVMPRFADPLQSFPIRIRANALADGVPSRDLCVSPDHALLVDGSLVQAGALVDGVAIERMTDLPERFVYYHIEVADHALILAENTPAETFVDNVTRRRFDNWREYEELYGEEALNIPELEMPRVRSSRQLPRPIATRLAARARRLFGGRRRGTAA